MRRLIISAALLAACPRDDDAPPASGTASGMSTSTSIGTSQEPNGLDSTGGAPACADDAHRGNQDPDAAQPIELGTDASSITLDDLVVCDSEPSDFFELQAECAGYLSIEVRKLEGNMPAMVLYEDDQPIEQLLDVSDFFLKPLQRHTDAGSYVLEVRHSGGPPQRYSLVVVLLPDSTCRP